jgi:uncharacterized protein YuzE
MVRKGSPVRVRTRALGSRVRLELAGDLNLDLDGEGRLLGIEILGARRFLPPELLR